MANETTRSEPDESAAASDAAADPTKAGRPGSETATSQDAGGDDASTTPASDMSAADLGEAAAFAPFGDDEASDRVEALEAEILELKDKALRAAADLQNYRKRAEKERRDAETYASARFARDILSVFDNLDQAVALADDALREQASGFVNGVELTRRELLNVFGKHKIELLQPEVGDRFDPNLHQAMAQIPTDAAAPGEIAQVMQSGFIQADRLLRPAMVAVAVAPPAPAPADASSENGGD